MDLLKQLLLTLRPIKFKRFFGSLVYPIKRDLLEHKYKSAQPLEIYEPSGNIIKAKAFSRGGYFYFERLELEIYFLTPDLVRVDWKPNTPPIPYGIVEQDWEEVETTFEEKSDCWEITSSSLKIIVFNDGAIAYQNAQGKTLRHELPPQRRTETTSQTSSSGWLHQAQLKDDECIYALGERAAPLNLRQPATTYQMWNRDAEGKYGKGRDPLYICIPVYLGLHSGGSYEIFYENPYPAKFQFEKLAIAEFEGGALRYYFATGTLPQLLDRYTQLTGRPFLPPRWALGYHHSRWGYEREKALRETAKSFESYDIPLNAMHLDIDCLDRFRSFTIDPDRFPHLQAFATEMNAKGIRLITIINPGIKANRNNLLFQEGREQDLFCKLPNGEPIIASVWPGECAFPDFTNPQARHWWTRQYEYLLDLGFYGFWHDMNEPAVFVQWGDPSLPPHLTQHYLEGRGGDHREAHNVYGLLQAQAGYEALCVYHPERRPFIVSRAGWAGLQRYAWTWTGDIEITWEALRITVAMVLNLGLSGIPYSGADIGGFKGNPGAELYLRWFQMSCFLPFCRTHSADNSKPRAPWTFGEPILSIIREFLRSRYRLMPYFYTLAWEANQKGYPLVRPLFWLDNTNNALWNIDDAFLLGDALLICPIVEEKATSRSLMLPKGDWYDFWDDTALEGAKQVNLQAPLERIPILVKAGSILPMQVDDELHLHLYPSKQGTSEGRIYSDAGDGYGEWRIDDFRLIPNGEFLALNWNNQGDYPFPYQKVRLCLHGVSIKQAWVNETEVEIQENSLYIEPFAQVRLKANF
jgi:alpha-glucosidase